jgi:hypothetical protein
MPGLSCFWGSKIGQTGSGRDGHFSRNGAAHGFSGDMALHFFNAFDQLVEVLFVHE